MALILRLELDPIACTGHGLCAGLLPELIELDEWGYPMLADGIPFELESHARRAVRACPALALRIRKVTTRERGQGGTLAWAAR